MHLIVLKSSVGLVQCVRAPLNKGKGQIKKDTQKNKNAILLAMHFFFS